MPTTSHVAQHNGVPTLFINGRPHSGMSLALYVPRTDWMTDFSKAGVNLFTIPATPTFSSSCFYLSKEAWISPDTYDYAQLDERVATTLAANPDAWIFPRLNVGVPPWWLKENPDEVCKFDNGKGQLEDCQEFGHPVPSWASQKFRSAAKEGLKRLIAHVEASSYADRIIGYHLASGTTEEWMFWGSNDENLSDYSIPGRQAFRDWVRRKYPTLEELRAAYSHPTVTHDLIEPPGRNARMASGFGMLRHPRHERVPIDYFAFLSDLVVDTMSDLAATVKELTKRQKTVGVFYGYVLELSGGGRLQNGGHLAIERALRCPDIDFVCSPSGYGFRQAGGDGTSYFMSALGSVQLHGKLWFDENDIQTTLSGMPPAWKSDADPLAKDILQQDKELSHVLTEGVGQWWFDVCGNRYDHPRLMEHIRRWVHVSAEAAICDRTPIDDVAFVVDPLGTTHAQVGHPVNYQLLVGQLPDLRRCGAASREYFISDLPQLERHRLLLFTTTFAPDEAKLRDVHAAKRDGRILVFNYAPGLFRGQTIDEGAMEELTGIKLKLQSLPLNLRTRLNGGTPLTTGLDGVICFENWYDTYPAVLPDDPDAMVLGTLADGRPSIVAKRFATHTVVYCASGPVPAAFLRSLATAADAHVYLETPDAIWASRDLLAVSVRKAGTRHIRLPRQATVKDLFGGEVVGVGVTEFEVDFGPLATRLFRLS